MPEVSLGLWQNFRDDRPLDTQWAIIRRAFDLGVCHLPPPALLSSETVRVSVCPADCRGQASSNRGQPARTTAVADSCHDLHCRA